MFVVELLFVCLSGMAAMGSVFKSRECGSAGVFVLTVCVVLTTCCTNCLETDHSDQCNNNNMTVSSAQSDVFPGESIQLICHKASANSSQLYFTRKSLKLTNTEILNSSAIQVTQPLTRAVLDSSEAKSYHYKCMEEDTCIGSKDIFVDYYPVEATNVTCRVYSWEWMRCWWSLWMQYRNSNNIVVTCDFADNRNYSTEMEAKEEYAGAWSTCPSLDLNQTGCSWNSDVFTNPHRLLLRIKVTNRRRRDAFAITNASFDGDKIVQLDPVEKSSIRIVKSNGRQDCVTLTWPVMGMAKIKTLTFNLTYSSSCTTSKTVFVLYNRSSKGLATTDICLLHPYSTYNVSLTGRYKKSQLWSDPTYVEFNTDKQVPEHCPRTSAGLYEHIEGPDSNLLMYWLPLSRCELNSDSGTVEYEVSMADQQKLVAHPVFYTKLMVKSEQSVKVSIQARNDIGYNSENYSIVVYPKYSGLTPSDMTVEFSNESDNLVYITINTNDNHVKGHTVVWCYGTTFCEKSVNWKVLAQDDLTTAIQVSDAQGYRYGLITEYQLSDEDGLTNTGIIWEKCLYLRGKVPSSPPRSVHRSDQQPGEGFRLEWLPFECSAGYIHHYRLSYCEKNTIGKKCNCTKSPVHQVNVSKHETSHTVRGLFPQIKVCVWLQGINSMGHGPSSDVVEFTIHAIAQSPWLYIGVILAILIVLTVAVFIFCRCQMYRKQLEEKRQKVAMPHIEDTQALLQNGGEANHSKPIEMQTLVSRLESVGDSGTSSLSPSSRNHHYSDPTPGNSDSAISSTTSQGVGIPAGNQQETSQSNTSTANQSNSNTSDQSNTSTHKHDDCLDSYQRASDVSVGDSNSNIDSYTKMTHSGSDQDSNSAPSESGSNDVVPDNNNSICGLPGERIKLIENHSFGFLSEIDEEEDEDAEYDIGDISAILGD